MAKPIQIAGLLRRTPVARTSSKVLRVTLLDLLEKVPEARSGGSEKGIHDLRVAVKRFREAFRLFRPVLRKKTFRRHRDWIEDLNDALGEVRDRDVSLARLRKLTAGLAEPPGSVGGLLARIVAERIGAAGALAAMLDRLQLEGVPAQLAAQIELLEQQAAPGGSTHEFARERVRERLLDVRARWAAARREATPESLHRVRIGNKRLRYAIEPFSRMLGKEVRRLYRSASRFHDVLGDLHDADSMAVMLETSMAGASRAERRAWEGLSMKVIRGRRVALRKALTLADKLEPLWDEAQRAVGEPRH
ncbi:MAG: CHAD domain-containing protein [Betaproteobacteria bacterium]|nr:MAG: CHAD domain-containing protein [Betaproteobacteria bacterium]